MLPSEGSDVFFWSVGEAIMELQPEEYFSPGSMCSSDYFSSYTILFLLLDSLPRSRLRPAGGDGEADDGEGGGAAAGGEGEQRAAEAAEASRSRAGGTGEPRHRDGAGPQHRGRRPAPADPGLGEAAGEEPQVPGREWIISLSHHHHCKQT